VTYPCDLERVLGSTCWSPSTKSEVSISTLSNIDCIALYIGGPWCHPCHGFKEELKRLYNKANQENKKQLEIVFCQWRGPRPDIATTPETQWQEYEQDMPWLVLDKDKSNPVQARFGCSFVPQFIVFKRDSNQLNVVTGIWEVTSFIQNFKEDAWPLTQDNYDLTQGFYNELLIWPGSYLGKDYESDKLYPKGNLEKIKKVLEKKPHFVSQPAPEQWTNEYFVPGGWKPVGLYPGVFVADSHIRIDSNSPIHPLHLACGCGYLDVVEYFLKQEGVDLEVPDGDGSTPLTWAAFANRQEVIKFLLSKGADRGSVLNISKDTWISIMGSPAGYDLVANHKI